MRDQTVAQYASPNHLFHRTYVAPVASVSPVSPVSSVSPPVYEVYADGGRLVTRGRNLDRLVTVCWRELQRGRYACGVYLIAGTSCPKVYDVERDGDAVTVWRGWIPSHA